MCHNGSELGQTVNVNTLKSIANNMCDNITAPNPQPPTPTCSV